MTTPSSTINDPAGDQAVRRGMRALGLLVVASSLTALMLTTISAIVSELSS